jgi:uroporphyrinogen-III synthase
MTPMRLLVTRPQPGAEHTATALRRLGHRVIVAPVLRVESVKASIPAGGFDGLVMTSANAARAMASHPRLGELIDLPLFAVGRRTAAAARDAGFTQVTAADGDAAALETLLRAGVQGRLLHLAGKDRSGELGAALPSAALSVETVVVYRAVPVEALAKEAVAELAAGDIDSILHYSPRSARVFVDLAERAGVWASARDAIQLCLSAQVARPLIAAGAMAVRTASTPDEDALIAEIAGNQ